MSLADLSARIYTIKSRKNVPFSTALTSMVREDLALRYSVFNIVKSLTGSEIIAQVAESRYGFRTPLQKEEDRKNKLKATREKRFQQFTANSLVTLNNKINTLAALTERNTTLIENLYNDLGHFRNQKKFTKRDMNVSAPKIPIRSRTVKFQIDQLKAELSALAAIAIGAKASKKLKKAAESGDEKSAAAATAAVAATAGLDTGKGLGTEPDKGPGPPTPGSSETAFGLQDAGMIAGEAVATIAAVKAADAWKRRRRRLRTVSTPTTQAATTVTKAAPTTQAVTTATKSPGILSRAASSIRGLGAGKLLGTGPTAIALLMQGAAEMASGRAGQEALEKEQAKVAKFGIKFLRGEDGAPIYEIDGRKYTSENLPPEFQVILDAYIGDGRSASAREAKTKIAANPELYKLLESVEGRMQVLPPPITSDTSAAIIAAAKAAQLVISEPEMISAGQVQVSVPAKFDTKLKQQKPVATAPPPAAPPPAAPPPAVVSGIDSVKKMVKEHEGVRYKAYKDSKGLWTIGIGHLIGDGSDAALEKSGYKGKTLTEKEVNDLYDRDFAHHVKIAEKTPGWDLANDIGKAAMIDLAFNMGAWWKGFKNTAKSLASGDFAGAAEGLTNSKWYTQVGRRAPKIVEMIRSGGLSTGYLAAIPYESASFVQPSIQPMPSVIPGAPVSVPPPPMVASATPATEASSDAVAGQAALVANKVVQSVVASLGDKVADIEKQVNIDREFPSVRYQA